MTMTLKAFEIDPLLKDVEAHIWARVNGFRRWKSELETEGLLKFAEGYKIFGFNRSPGDDGWTYREWLPEAKQVFLIGEFNQWQNSTPLSPEAFGRWFVHLPDVDGSWLLHHSCQVKVRVETNSGEWIERVPAWTKLAWQDPATNLFNGVFWAPASRYEFKYPRPCAPSAVKVYEAHVGMASELPKVASYLEFADKVLPRIKRLGYNAVQLMAVSEHAHYGCFGYHVTSFFAPASRSGTPEELKEMIDRAHGLGMIVLMDLVHAHCSSNALDGIARMDGSDHCYTHGGALGHHSQWDSKIFHYTKYEVLRFLLSNVRWWLEEYQFDGFRFDGVTSILYRSHGTGKAFGGGYEDYFGADADEDAHIFLMLANDVIHTLVPSAVTIAEDVSGMPTLCLPVEDGGFGFDYRLSMAVPDMFIKLLKECGDEQWSMGHICYTLTNRRWKERCIAYAESHDQAIVGDKTVAFWLMDSEMYTGMSLLMSEQPSLVIDRGLALHKMIRLLVLGLGGEGYLNFMGNEFGHPEWIDFPRPENGWSHAHCRRRWDLADDHLLRYRFFQTFDEMMHELENRYSWMSSEHQYVTVKDDGDKLIVFERGPLLFAFNFHPYTSYEHYRVGMSWNEPMRTVLDSDEGRFGGHMRLEYGHGHPFETQGAFNGRPSSLSLYLPCRTVQVLAPDRLTQVGISVRIAEDFLLAKSISSITDVSLTFETHDGPVTKRFAEIGEVAHLPGHFATAFTLRDAGGAHLDCQSSVDGVYRANFPGLYVVSGAGFVAPVQETLRDCSESGNGDMPTSSETHSPVIQSSECWGAGNDLGEADPAQHVMYTTSNDQDLTLTDDFVDANSDRDSDNTARVDEQTTSTEEPATLEVLRRVSSEVTAWRQSRTERSTHLVLSCTVDSHSDAQVVPPGVDEAVPTVDTDTANGGDVHPLERQDSGLHFLNVEDLNDDEALQLLSGTGLPKTYQETCSHLKVAPADLAKSYHDYGIHQLGEGWTYREWIPGAQAVYLIGDFNAWDRAATPLQRDGDVWCGSIGLPQSEGLTKGSKYKLHIVPTVGDKYDALPAWCTRTVIAEETQFVDAVVWPLQAPSDIPRPPKQNEERIYECHLGLIAWQHKGSSFHNARAALIPRVARNGYTSMLLIGVLECKEFADMGSQPTCFFAPSRLLGTPEELQEFVAEAHTYGLRVYLSIAQDRAADCEDGLGSFFFRSGSKGLHEATGARIFDYASSEVTRYLISNLFYWVTEFGFDGFRFQGVSSVRPDHGRSVTTDGRLHDVQLDQGTVQHLMLANALLTEIGGITTIAEDGEFTPSLCEPVFNDGLGFDLRMAVEAPQVYHKLLTSCRDEDWSMSDLCTQLPVGTIGCLESSEECVLGRRPLKVAMLSWETLHTIAAGGIAPHVTELAAALHGAGHEVHIFSRSTQPRTWEHTVWGVVYHEVAFGAHPDFVDEICNMCQAFVSAVCEEESAGTFDFIHGHDWLVGPAVIQLTRMGKQCVFTVHSTESGRCGSVQYGGQSQRIRTMESEACHTAARVIAVSEVLREEVCQHYGVHGAKVSIIYNGIHGEPIANMEWKDEWSGDVRKDKGFAPMAPMFLFVGRLATQKGPDLLLEAIPHILEARADARFVFVGDGHLKSSLEARRGQLGLGHVVCFTGSVQSGTAHLKALFKACDAVVVPSRNEPFGIVVLEAWAAGKPVVASTHGGPRDFVHPGRDGYLVNPDPGSIALGVCKICEDFDHARWMGRQAQQKALRQFSWQRISRQTATIYFEQLCLHGAPHRACRHAGISLSSILLGPHLRVMGVMQSDHLVDRGVRLLKMLRLFSVAMSGATLTWMGSEFGHSGPVDVPRLANDFSSDGFVPFGLADSVGLKYKHLEMFEAFLNRTAAALCWQAALPTVTVQDEASKVVALVRAGCLFVFNFHPSTSQRDYTVTLPENSSFDQDQAFCVALDTEDRRFGGTVQNHPTVAARKNILTLTLRPRAALVFAPSTAAEVLMKDSVLRLACVDAFVQYLPMAARFQHVCD